MVKLKLIVNWKALGMFIIELLKLTSTMYIIYILADPQKQTETVLSGLIGVMWYVLFIKGDYGEKK